MKHKKILRALFIIGALFGAYVLGENMSFYAFTFAYLPFAALILYYL